MPLRPRDVEAFGRQALDNGADRGSVPPLAGGQPRPEGRAQAHQSRSRCWWPWFFRRRRPMPVSTRRRRRCLPWPTRRRRWWRWARALRADQDHRPVPQQGQECGRSCRKPGRRARRAGAARARGAGGAAGRRAQDRQCRPQHRLWRADHCGRHAYLPRRQPDRACARKDRPRSSRNSEKAVPAASSCMRTTG